jgi:large subunit ribosomal protein L3
MAKLSRPRYGSLQYWPRKRAQKLLPSANWKIIKNNSKKETKGLLGFIGYKVGMMSAIVKDSTPDSMTKGKEKAIPVTIVECPKMKVFSIRLYKHGIIKKEFVISAEKELKRILKVPKDKIDIKKVLEEVEKADGKEIEDISVIAYSVVRKSGLKKTPDIIEIGLNGELKEKIEFIKKFAEKEIAIADVFKKDDLVDVRALTKGKGLSGTVKRFGIGLKSHKSEKGQRRPGSLGPWHPARVTFRTPMAGQLGMFSRIVYNLRIINIGDSQKDKINPSSGFNNYGNVNSDYIIIYGSIQGPQKRQIFLTASFRPTKKQLKKKYEFLKLR